MAPILDIGPNGHSDANIHHSMRQDAIKDKSMPIAVVGMSFRGPADATSVENLWKMIVEGREGWSKIPKDRWNNDAFYHPDNTRHGTINVEGGHFFSDDLARFDAPFFNMTNAEAAALDPQQRLLLEGAFEAFENAGLPLDKVMGSKTSCFVGSFSGDYTDMLLRDPECVPMYQCTNAGQSRAITANRTSYFFDLKGPSVTVDTACSGSLVALHLACQSLRTGDASMALAAGVNTVLSHEFMSTMSMMKFLSPDGRCYTFDDRGNGYARGEGVGFLVLKPLADALRDHDTIQAVIRGSGSNQDGRTTGITLPSGQAQEALIRDVYEAAGLDPLETEFAEAHGTGTQAGDPTETEALSRVFGVGRSADFPLRIGSIKTNVGHMEGASGIGGVIKAVMMLQNRTFLPNRNFRTLNPRIFLDEWKQKIQLEVEPWETPGSHRVSVNSFGYGGSNAHVVLEDAQGYLSSHGLQGQYKRLQRGRNANGVLSSSDSNGEDARVVQNGHENGQNGHQNGHNGATNGSSQQPRMRLITLSGFDQTACETQIKRLRDYLESVAPQDDETFLDNLAYTLGERRTNFMWKAAVSGSSIQELRSALDKATPVRAMKKPVLGFVFTGQGAQWCGMGKELLDVYPVFSETIDRIGAYLSSLGAPFSVREELTRDPKGSQINLALYSQAMCSAVQIALVELLRSWGITPASVTGHSSGEIGAAYATGALSMENAMRTAYYRGVAAHSMQQNGAGKGAMMAVGMTKEEAEPHLRNLTKGKAVVACVNSPSSLTISGDVDAIDELKAQLDEQGTFARKLAVEVAYHSHHMELVAQQYRSYIDTVKPKNPGESAQEGSGEVEFFSSVTGARADALDLGPDYWVSNMVGQVKFAESLRKLCLESSDGKARTRKARRRAGAATKVAVELLIEIGPHSALAGPVKQILAADEKLKAASIGYATALVRNNSAVKTLLELAEKLYTKGYPVDFAAINRPHTKGVDGVQCLVDLPPYPWNHTRTYWAEPRVSKVYRQRKYPRTDLLGVPDRHASESEPRWRNHIRTTEIPWVRDHKIQSNIVYPAAGYLVMAIEAINQCVSAISTRPLAGFILRDVAIEAAMVLSEQTPTEVLVSLWPHGTGSADTVSQWHEFRVASVTDSNKWTQHCSGLVAAKYTVQAAEDDQSLHEQALENQQRKALFEEAERSCTTAVDVAEYYGQLAKVGLEYGESFANVTAARAMAGRCLAKVTVADTAATMPRNFEYPFVIHPTTLDSILHPLFVALSADAKLLDPAIPVSIDELHLCCGLDAVPGQPLDVVATASHKDRSNITADIVVVNDLAEPGINLSISGLICRVLDNENGIDTEEDAASIAYNFEWAPDVDLLSETSAGLLCAAGEDDGDVSSQQFTQYVGLYTRTAAQLLDTDVEQQMAPHLRKQWTMLRDLYSQGSDPEPTVNTDRLPSGVETEILTAIGEGLPAILRGETDASQILSADNLLEKYWTDSLAVTQSYRAAARYLDILGHKNPHQAILEINAGSGAAGSVFLDVLANRNGAVPCLESYTATDPDTTMLEVLSQSLSPWQDLVTVKQFDLAADPDKQELQPGSYDVVLLPRGLCLVPDKTRTLEAARRLLKPGGRVIVIDDIKGHASVFRSFLFGTFPEFWAGAADAGGWWSRDEWQQALRAAQFHGLDKCIPTIAGENRDGPYLIVARSEPAEKPSKNDVLIIAEEGEAGVAVDLLRRLVAEQDLSVEVSTWPDAVPVGRLCIVLSELKRPILPSPTAEDWEMVKTVLLKSAGVLWVVRGGTISCPNPTASLSFGFARTVRSELGDSKIVTLDLQPETSTTCEKDAHTVFEVFRHQLLSGQSGTMLEQEYAERNGTLLIPRVKEAASLNKTLGSYLGVTVPEDLPLHQLGRNLRAVVDVPTHWETAHFIDTETPTPLPDNFISIEIRAAGLIPRDLLKADSGLGSQCSGVVRAVGASVTDFKIGDRVACIASNGVANTYQGRSTSFQKIPDDMSFASAAALPSTYCTAYYAVYELARPRRDEVVLIHGAAEPCGQALVQLCRLLGIEPFVTVDAADDKDQLAGRFGLPASRIFNNKDDTVIKAIRRETGGRGADIIINVAGADSEQFRLSWRGLAPYGRFIDIVNEQTPRAGRLDMAAFAKDALFASFNLANLVDERRHVADRIWAEVMCLFRTKALAEPPNTATFSFSELGTVIEGLDKAQYRQAVVTADPGVLVKAVPQRIKKDLFHASASYILVGGLGGIGRAIATWMIDNGARHLVFVNRSGTSKREAQETVEALQSKGATVKVYACDVSDTEQVRGIVDTMSRDDPPIRGVIQGAMVLRDNYVEKMLVDDYLAVMQPKFNGTWNLHNLLPQDLDFFLMLSSVSGIIGNATQSAYAAANTFMDAFAAYRNSLGLPAVSLDLGVIGGVGYLSENKDLAAAMQRQGFHVTTPDVLLALIQSAIALPRRKDCEAQTVTGLGAWKKDHSLSNYDVPLFAHMRRRFLASDPASASSATAAEQQPAQLLPAAATLEEAASLVLKFLVRYLANRLSTSEENIDTDKAPSDYGVDSLVAVEVRKWIGKDLGASVAMLEIIASESLVALAGVVAGKSRFVKVEKEKEDQ